MPNMKDFQINKHLRLLFSGRSGVGKTLAGMSFPGKKYLLSLDGRLANLAGMDIDYDAFNDTDGWAKVGPVLDRRVREGYQLYHIAGLTGMIDTFVEDSLNFIGDRDAAKGKKGKQIGQFRMTGIEHYGYINEAIRQIMNVFLGMPAIVILEAHIVDDYDDKGKVKGERLLATAKLEQKIPSKFDDVWVFSTKPNIVAGQPPNYKCTFRSAQARTSFAKMPDSIEWTAKPNSTPDFYRHIAQYLDFPKVETEEVA